MAGAPAPGPDGARRRAARVDAVLLLAVAGILLAVTTGFDRVPALLAQGVSPAFFPRLLLVALAGLALLLPLESRLARESAAPSRLRPEAARRVIAAAAILFLAVLLLPGLGMVPVLGLAAVGLGLLWGERRPLVLLALAVALPASLYWLFSRGLGVPFETGRWLGG